MSVDEKNGRLQKLQQVLQISRELASTFALEPLLHEIVRVAGELTESEAASILLLDTRTGELRFRAATGDPAGQLRDIPVPVEDSIAGSVLLSGEPAIISDTQTEPRHYAPVGQRLGREVRSLLAVPLRLKERCIGVLEAINKQAGDAFAPEDVQTLTDLAAQAAVAIENARLVGDLQKAYQQLEELDRLKSDFIAIASHELRTPLGVILLYADMLRGQVGEKGEQELDAVLRAALRLRHIIETMLNLRYLETGEMVLQPSRFDLRAEVEAACEDHAAIAETGRLTLVVDLPEEPVALEADREKVRVILDNLISNACKFTPPGGQVQVSVSESDAGEHAQISVADTGIGIPSGEIEKVFGRFYQVEDHMTRSHGGMGLGLSIVKGLTELHGGRVSVESTPERGSRFIVLLPARASTGIEDGRG